MTEPDVLVRRIRDAFDRDLAGYQAPADLAQRARAGGLRRARGARRRLVTYGISATAAAAASAVVTAVVLAPQPGTSPKPTGQPNPPSATGPMSTAGLPSAQSVGKAVLTAVDGVSDDILYSTQTGGGSVPTKDQDWNWPAQPAVGQQARMRELDAQQTSRGQMQPFEDFAFSYVNHGPGLYKLPRTVPFQVTMVCYTGSSGCGFNYVEVPAGTWMVFPLPPSSSDWQSDVSPGSLFSPAAIAQGIANGEYQVEGRTQLDGRPTLVLRETGDEMQPKPFVLWVDAQTYLPRQWTSGSGKFSAWGTFAYLPPTPANMALFKVPIPKGYPKASAGNG
jgi:hypothetical protein